MISAKRQTIILELLEQKKVVTIEELAEPMRVSLNTIRRDLQELERQGYLRRTHGGAVLLEQLKPDDLYTYETRQEVQVEAKQAISEAAAGLVKPNESLILHSGTTVSMLARLLKNQTGLTILTNSLLVIEELQNSPGIDLLMTGGSLDRARKLFHGPIAEQSLEMVRADKVFMSASSVSAKLGFSTSAASEVRLELNSMANCSEVYLLVDHTKFERSAFWLVSSLNRLTAVIVNKEIKPVYLREMEAANVRVILV
jgi:DeoR/GlpR family transcriptional regulator of sugar metabolism